MGRKTPTAANARIEYEEVDRGHDSADLVYGTSGGLAWLAQFRRDPVPPLVRFRMDNPTYNEGAGVVITARGVESRIADLRIEWVAPDSVRIASRNVTGFTMRVPAGAPDPISLVCDGQPLAVAGRPAAIQLEAARDAAGEVRWSARAVHTPVETRPEAQRG